MRRFPMALFGSLLFALATRPQDEGRRGAPETDARTEKAINKGLRWLLKAQNRDGSWGHDLRSQPADISITSLAALALMAAGNVDKSGPDPEAVDAVHNALEFILNRGRRMRDGIESGETTIVQSKLGQRIHNFMATLFLTQIYGMQGPWAGDDQIAELKDLLRRLTETIDRTQESDGSWHKAAFGALKATCHAWLALRAAHGVGIKIQTATAEKTLEFLRKQFNPNTRLFDRDMNGRSGGYQPLYNTASCLRALCGMGEGGSHEVKASEKELYRQLKSGPLSKIFLTCEGEDYMACMMIAHAFVRDGGEPWERWNVFLRNALLEKQNPDGSWTGTACISGRTFATACSLLTLLAPFRSLPMIEQ